MLMTTREGMLYITIGSSGTAAATASKWARRPAAVGLVVVGRDDQRGVGAGRGRHLGQLARVAGVVGAGAADQQDVVADLGADRAQQLDRLLVGQGRALAGGAADDEPVRAVLEQVGGQAARRGVVSTAPSSSNGVAIAVRTPSNAPSSLPGYPVASGLESSKSSFSRPTVKRSGSSPTLRTASSTPGMKERRSIESWRIESVWPSPPKITSWWATRPGSRTEWIGWWTLPPAASISSCGALGGARGGVELAVVVQLDDLALGHVRGDRLRDLHQQHGADREVGGDEAVGARDASAAALAASRSKPVVPTTTWTPASRQARTLPSAVSGTVKSTTTSASPSTSASSTPSAGSALPARIDVLGALDRLADRLAHAPGGAGDRDPDHAATRLSLTGASACRKRSSSAPTQAAERRSAP